MFGDFNLKLAILVLYILYPNNISYNNLCVSRPSPKEIKPRDRNIRVFLRAYFQGGDGKNWQEDGGGEADVFEVFDDEGHGVHLKGVVFCTGKNN